VLLKPWVKWLFGVLIAVQVVSRSSPRSSEPSCAVIHESR
jgi:hypothetical protein